MFFRSILLLIMSLFFFFNDTATTEIYTLSLHDALPISHVCLSAGREGMSDELQALCFLAGANSIFYGEKLLTTGNPDIERDRRLLARLGLAAEGTPRAPDTQELPAAPPRAARAAS